MKAYISADLEGIAGVITKEQQTKGTPEYGILLENRRHI